MLLQVVVDARGSRITGRHVHAALPAAPSKTRPQTIDDEAVLAEVRSLGECSAAELRTALSSSKSTIQRCLRRLSDAGEVEETGAGAGRGYRVPAWRDLDGQRELDDRERLAVRLAATAGRVTRPMLSDAGDLPARTANRVLAGLVEARVLGVEGAGRSREYVLAEGTPGGRA